MIAPPPPQVEAGAGGASPRQEESQHRLVMDGCTQTHQVTVTTVNQTILIG